jgi:hypothetical protein
VSDTFDVNRATAIIEHAIAANMFETMPQGDADKIVAAEQLVELARQVQTVKDGLAAQDGEEAAIARIPHWPVAEKILLEAHVFVGSDRVALNGTTTQLPSAPPSSGEEREPSEPASSAPTPDVPPSQELPGTPSRSDGEPSGQATPQESVPPSPVPSTSGDPVKGETWTDASGTEWLLLTDGGGQTVEVRKVATGEETVAPAGMLKRRVSPAVDPSSTAVAAQEDHEQDEKQEAAPKPDIATGESDHEPEVVITPDPGKPDEPVKVPELTKAPTESAPTDVPEHDDEGDDRYQTLLAETEADYTPAGMPIPHDLDDPPDIKPENFDEVPDRVARALYSKFNALAARAKFLHDVEDARARECKMVLQLFMRGARRLAREKLGSSATVTELEGWAEDNDENVSTWKDRANRHAKKASAYGTFFDIYTQHVVVLSRDWSMRDKQMNS